MKPGRWFFVRSGPGESAWNMALDEALLEATQRLGCPIFRSYGWQEPAATFGYFQKYNQVAQLTPLRPLVRRPTGGGIVPHDRDWTYSLAVPPGHGWYELVAIESYRRMHEWIRDAFASLGVETCLAPHALRSAPGQCFAGHEHLDLLWQGRKIAGAAQRRRRDGLLIQGSLQPPSAFKDRSAWENTMSASGQHYLGTDPLPWSPDQNIMQRALELVRQKYSRAEYNEKR